MRLFVVAAIIAAAVVAVVAQARVEEQRGVSIDALGPRYTLDELRADADLVVVARAGEQKARWNSADNQAWTAVGADPNRPLIYSQTELAVLRVLKGVYPGDDIEVWTVGGSVADMTMTFSNAPQMRGGDEYLLMLDRVEIPLREGTQAAWLPIGLGQGIFVAAGTEFQNVAGETTSAVSFDE